MLGSRAKHGARQIMAHSGTEKQLGVLGSKMSSGMRPRDRWKWLGR